MRRLGLTVCLAALSLATAAHAGWEGLEWGMSPEAVAAARPDRAKLDKGSVFDTFKGETMGDSGVFQWAGAKVKAGYYFKDGGLIHISMMQSGGDCRVTLDQLEKTYGQVLLEEHQGKWLSFMWHDRASNTKVSLVTTRPTFCVITFERLDLYEAADDALIAAHQGGSPK